MKDITQRYILSNRTLKGSCTSTNETIKPTLKAICINNDNQEADLVLGFPYPVVEIIDNWVKIQPPTGPTMAYMSNRFKLIN